MKQLLNKNLVIAVLIVIITIGVLSKTGCNPKIENTNDKVLDSLQSIVDAKELREMELQDKIELMQYSIDSVSKVKQKVIIKYSVKEAEIKRLPFDDGIIFLSKNISFDNNFPHKMIVNFDTAVLINKQQLIDVNTIIVEKQGCEEILKQTNKEVELLEKKDSVKTELIKVMQSEDSAQESQIDDLKGNILVERNNVAKLNRKLKFRKYLSTIKESIMAGVIAYLIIK